MVGAQLVAPGGEAVWNLGGGGGVIWDGEEGERHGVSAHWDLSMLPPAFQTAERLTLRYVQPGGYLVLEETWEFLPGSAE